MLRKIKIFINNIAALIVFRVLKFIFPKKSNKGEGILFILLAPIGDQVISTIIFQNESFFTEKIYFLVERKYNGVWEDYLGKINIISLNSKLYKWLLPYRIIWIYRIRNLKIQKTINLNDNKSTVTDELSIFSGANEIIALSYESEKLQKFHKKFINKYYDMILFNNDVNQFEKLFGLLKKLGLQNPIRETRFYLNWNTFDKVEELLKKSGTQKNDRFITIAPFASKRFRSWPLQNFKKLIVQIIESANYKILLLGDNQFADEIDEISRININSIINLAGKTSIVECAGIIKLSKIFIGNDSGLAHIAKALNISLIAIIGGGMYNRFFPYNMKKNEHYLYEKMNCFGCEWKCIYKNPRCLTEVKVEKVFKQVQNHLDGTIK